MNGTLNLRIFPSVSVVFITFWGKPFLFFKAKISVKHESLVTQTEENRKKRRKKKENKYAWAKYNTATTNEPKNKFQNQLQQHETHHKKVYININ